MKELRAKKYFILFGLLLGLFGLFTFLTLNLTRPNFSFFKKPVVIESVLQNFRQDHPPLTEINLSALYGGHEQFQVLHPLLDIKKIRAQERDLTCGGTNDLPALSDGGFFEETPTKRVELDNFLAGKSSLPEDFLTTPPFVDGLDHSYVYLLMRDAPAPFNKRNWVEEHLSFFKISELAEVLKKYQINDQNFEVLSRFSESEMEDVVKGMPLVLTPDYLLVKNQSRFGFSPLSYWVYDARDFREDLKNGPYEISTDLSNSLCLQQIGNACWSFSAKTATARLYHYSLFFSAVFALGLISLFGVYLKGVYEKNKEQNKRRLALQVLSHEFRTPVSSLLLLVDRLLKILSSASQEDLVTRISGEVFKLQRIVEMSKIYLQAEGKKTQTKTIKIPSVNLWISDFVSEASDDVQCALLADDKSIQADPFWLKYILSNLVQNALVHGKPPVYIRLAQQKNRVRVTVEDQGRCEFDALNQMTEAFAKSSQSQGMGLGLNIAQYILDDLGTEMQFSKDPTSFTLFFAGQEPTGDPWQPS